MIEDALRDTFAAQAATGTAGGTGDPGDRALAFAESAMTRAGRIRQRQAMATALAGVLAVALASLATLQVMTGRHRSDQPTVLDVAPQLTVSTASAGQSDTNATPSAG